MALRPSLLFWYGRPLTKLKRRARALEVFRFLLAAREELAPAIELSLARRGK